MKLKIHLKALGIVLGVVLFWGCDNWLDVRPESELNEDQMFATEQGYMDALYGVYVNMGKNELYGGSLPLTMDLVAQTFDVAPGRLLSTRIHYVRGLWITCGNGCIIVLC